MILDWDVKQYIINQSTVLLHAAKVEHSTVLHNTAYSHSIVVYSHTKLTFLHQMQVD